MSTGHTPRRQPRRTRRSRYELGVEIRREREQLGSMIIRIDVALRRLNNAVDRAVQQCHPKGSGSIIGSLVQVPQNDPPHEQAFQFLDAVAAGVENLLREAQ